MARAELQKLIEKCSAQLILGLTPRVEHRDARKHSHHEGAERQRDECEGKVQCSLTLPLHRCVDGSNQSGIENVLSALVNEDQHEARAVAWPTAQQLSPNAHGDGI